MKPFALSLALTVVVTACTDESDEPACGDGVVDPGETSNTCCADAGCPRGVCNLTTGTCVHPWTFTCPAQTEACADDLPYVCDANPPSYDCSACGCPEGHTCFEDFCFADNVSTLERSSNSPPTDLPLGDYFPLLDWAATTPAMTLAELFGEIDTLLREDGRRSTMLLGESHNSPDERAVGVQILRELSAGGWVIPTVGIEWGGAPILDPELFADLELETDFLEGDLTNDTYCDAAVEQAGDRINSQGLYVQFTGSGHTSQEVCHHPYHWTICDLPHTAECLASSGKKSITVILFDPHVWLWVTDRILLWRLGDFYPNATEFTANLEAALVGWESHMALQQTEARFDATANGRDLNVRILPALHADDVYFAYFPRPGRPAYLMRSFQGAWNDPTLQAFFLAHSMEPKHCSISWDLGEGTETFWLHCNKDGYGLQAQVDGVTFALENSSTTTP